jgi:hypothetical protein
MCKMLHKLWKREDGQSLVFIALAVVALIGMAALALDGGYAFAQRRRVQNAADLAALAGARAIGMGKSAAEVNQQVNYYAQANGASTFSYYYVDAQGNSVGSLVSARGVHVDAQSTFNTFFAGIFNIRQMTAVAPSQARLYGIGGMGNLLPMLVHESTFQYNQVYELWDDNPEAPGGFGWADWDNWGGASELANDIANPSNSGEWNIGDLVPPETGINASSQVRNALNLWKNRNVTVPLYDQVTGSGNNIRYRLSSFGEFVLTNYQLTSGSKSVSGYFIQYVRPGKPGGPTFGLQGVKLSQ